MTLRDEARWIIGEIGEAKRLAKAVGKPQLANSAIEAGRIEEYDADGSLMQIVGEQHDGTHAPVTVNGPVPPEPVPPVLTAGIGSVEGRWSGKFVGEALSPMDLSHVALHASRLEVFTPSNETQLATITGELGDVAVVLLEPGEWTFGLVAVSKAGKWSPLSETVTIDVPDYPSPVDIQDELIRFDEVTGGLITESGQLGERLDHAQQDLAAHEGRLQQAEIDVNEALSGAVDVERLHIGTGIINQLVAEHIAGRTAAFQQVDVKNLFVTTGTLTEAVINKLWADVVMSRKATFNMLAVGDFQNYLATGIGYKNEAIDWASGLTPDFVDTPPGLAVSFKSAKGAGTKGSSSSHFDVTPGDEYEFVVWAKADVPNSRLYIEMRDQNNEHAMTSTRIDDEDLFWGNSSYPVNSAPVPTAWIKWRCRVVPKPGVRTVRIGSIYFNHTNGTETNAQVWLAGLSIKRRFGGEVIIDGSMKAKQLDVEDLAANAGFIADLTARIVKSEMFVGKEFQGGTFTGSVFQTSGISNVGWKLDNAGLRVYGPDGGDPVTEIRSDGGTVYSITDPTTGEVLAALDSEGGFTGQSLSVAGEARIDGALVTGSDPLTTGHGTGRYGATMNGRDILGAAFMEAVNMHPNMLDGHAWMTILPHGMKINAWNNRTDNLGPDNRWGWESGETRMMLTATMEAWPGRQYLLAYRTPAVRETSAGGAGDLGAALVRYASGTGVVNAGKGSAVQGTQVYLSRGGGYQEAAVTTLLRCPEDIPEGRIMFGVELYTHVGRTAQSTDTPGARRWELSVIDMGMRISGNSGEDVNYRTGGVEPPTPDPAPKPKPAREYTDTVDATWWQAYTGDGAKATHSTYSGSAAQGRSPYAPGNGVMRGLVGFPSQAGRLSGAIVKKIEVYVYAKHWHSSAGGTACIGLHNHAGVPDNWSSSANDVKRQKLKKPEGRWITLPSSVHAGFKSGDTKGISFLPPSSSTSTEYYGLIKGNRTKLRITYTK